MVDDVGIHVGSSVDSMSGRVFFFILSVDSKSVYYPAVNERWL